MTSETARLRELLAINRAITSTSDYEETLGLIVEKACTFAKADACLLLLAESGENVNIAATFGDVPETIRSAPLVLDEHLDARIHAGFELGPAGAVTAVPMIRGGSVRGSLVIVRRRRLRDADSEQDEQMLSALADHASIVLGHVAHLRALKLAEAKSSGILAISADAIVSVDADQRITMFNDGAERLFGYAKDEVIGKHLEILVPERYRGAHQHHVDAFRAGAGSPARSMGGRARAIIGRRKNGDEFPADAAISKLDVDGGVVLTVIVRDMTQQRRVEEEQRFLAEVGPLLASTLEYEETLGTVADLAVREIADLCIVEVMNQRGEGRRLRVASRDPAKAWICELLSRADDPARGAPDLMASVSKARRTVLVQSPTDDILASFASDEEQYRALRAAEIRSMVAVPLTAGDRLLGAIAFISTNTARVYGASDVALAEELARRAALSIENARLYREARLATQARDDVLGVVAHDLRNPLHVILLHVALLSRSAAGNAAMREDVEIIRRGVARMDRLIQDLLDVTAIEAGQLSVRYARLAPERVLADVIEAQRSLADAALVELRVELVPDLPALWADRDRLAQIFENLIGNALKFTGARGCITVGAKPQDGAVLFWIADTGHGIEPDHAAHVFDRFWQADKTTRHGAGLGLPIVKGLIEAHGGRIWLESAPGRGSTFFFTIPTAR